MSQFQFQLVNSPKGLAEAVVLVTNCVVKLLDKLKSIEGDKTS